MPCQMHDEVVNRERRMRWVLQQSLFLSVLSSMGDGWGMRYQCAFSLSPDVNDVYWNNVLRDPMPDDDDDEALGAIWKDPESPRLKSRRWLVQVDGRHEREAGAKIGKMSG
jgi:hypothetical protein